VRPGPRPSVLGTPVGEGLREVDPVSVAAQVEVVIDRPVAEVAAFAGDPSNAPRWYANIASVSWQTTPPVSVARGWTSWRTSWGAHSPTPTRSSKFDPNRRLVMRTADGLFPMVTT
jgi:Polyketide cyclase / dehydrase and lipid transport